MPLFLLAGIVFVINIPFGYWRKTEKKFSIQWFLAIHIPVIISILLRYLSDIPFKWENLILFVFVFVVGQYTGKLVFSYRKRKKVKS